MRQERLRKCYRFTRGAAATCNPGFDKLSPGGWVGIQHPPALSLSKGLARAATCNPGFDKLSPGGVGWHPNIR
jgi:hypothetical protein